MFCNVSAVDGCSIDGILYMYASVCLVVGLSALCMYVCWCVVYCCFCMFMCTQFSSLSCLAHSLLRGQAVAGAGAGAVFEVVVVGDLSPLISISLTERDTSIRSTLVLFFSSV